MKRLAKSLIRFFSPGIPQPVLDDVYAFCKTAQILRTPENCSKYFSGKYDVRTCKKAMACLYDRGMMGAYTFGPGIEPHPYMREYILNLLPDITTQSKIMEIGPGNRPLFNEREYPNWYGCDVNYKEGHIDFSGKIWGKGMYKKIYNGSWDNLVAVCKTHNLPTDFDLVCGCHSFEHTYKPVGALREVAQILRESSGGGGGGHLVVFVPDGFSTWGGNYDKTHTVYMNPDMIDDFFRYAGCFKNISYKQFRTNMDLVIIAEKRQAHEY